MEVTLSSRTSYSRAKNRLKSTTIVGRLGFEPVTVRRPFAEPVQCYFQVDPITVVTFLQRITFRSESMENSAEFALFLIAGHPNSSDINFHFRHRNADFTSDCSRSDENKNRECTESPLHGGNPRALMKRFGAKRGQRP